jgi:hypothetical protein
LVCINNAFNQYGTITAFRTPMAAVPADVAPTGDNIHVTGADAFVELGTKGKLSNANAYIQPVRSGAYCVSMRGDDEYSFHSIRDEESRGEDHTAWVGPSAVAPGNLINFKGPILFWDNSFDSIVFKIEVPVGAPVPQDFIVKIWKAYEYKPTFNSFPYQLAGNSAPYDPAALHLYSQMARALPVAVPSKDNPDFWKSILQTVNIGSGLLRGLPGLGGALAKGVHAVTSYLDSPNVTERSEMKTGKVVTRPRMDGSGGLFVERSRGATKERKVRPRRQRRAPRRRQPRRRRR